MLSNLNCALAGTPQLRTKAPLCAALTALFLGACAPDRVITNTITPNDYRDRHPIALAEDATSVDIFPSGDGLDLESRRRVRSFATEYKNLGRGTITAHLPRGSGSDALNRAALDGIRYELGAQGVRGSLNVGSYRVSDPRLAAPIRLSFVGVKAKVTSRCGEWPRDLASGSSLAGWSNTPYWNHGCATQNALAAQVADPRDLAGPRGETPSDVLMRSRAIKAVRNGQSPATGWTVESTSIGGQ